jgi:hypothetical protein
MASLFASGATLTLPCSLSRLLAATLLLALGSTGSQRVGLGQQKHPERGDGFWIWQPALWSRSGCERQRLRADESWGRYRCGEGDALGGQLHTKRGDHDRRGRGRSDSCRRERQSLSLPGWHRVEHYEGVDASFAGSTAQASLVVQ